MNADIEAATGDDGKQKAASLLSVALDRGWLELAPTANIAELEDATNQAEFGVNPEARAKAVMAVWLEHEGVEEVYVSDDDLMDFLSKW